MNLVIFGCRGAVLWLLLGLASNALAAGFLEMPDTTEVPALERDSMLLDMDVPGVRDRDPDPRAGPRLNVREFRVQGIVEYPHLGIYRQEIIDKVEAIRFDLMNEDAILESGYTLEELAAISDLIVEIERDTRDRHVGPMEVQRLVFHVREQRRQRGLSLGMIETVADTITQYYRERGFILAKAYIPEQRVREGIVNLTVLLGNLGEVQVENNGRYRDRTIARVFDDIIDQPVKAGVIEERLFLVNDLPGLRAQGYFEPGTQVGDSRMVVNVTDERWYNANLRLDNHGSQSSGEYRLYGDFYWHNPTGIGDQLQIGVLNSFEPDNSLYGSVRYRVPAYFPRLRFSVGASNNDFVLARTQSEAIDALRISGRSQVVDAGFEYHLNRTRVKNSALHMTWSQIGSRLRFGDAGGVALDSKVENINLSYRFDVLDERRRVLHQGGIGVTASRFVEQAEHIEEQDQNPFILPLDYTLLGFWQLPFTDTQTRVLLRLSGQYSGTSLSSINQFSLSGPNRSRGYALNAFFADDGVHAGIDWIFPGIGASARHLQPLVFADYGYGIAYQLLEGVDDTIGEMSNIGLGFRFNAGRAMRGSLTIAQPLTSRNTAMDDRGAMDEGVRAYFDIQYSF
ncbi:ShlB/FhaC/HecB family hemolysin secretion/activation protein [Marinimicrobium alkaliphilum]|uniref:ShlB/FhaC/HecB family hemolysin secretion/activation protein n=1 Tax=Marinimicrobium alkaliphilum TaxID=2202654 RepID=UPI000DBA27F9|nr:ShlB/FhaC/HecB family hemolysin secretion/activation protein [Marinimicrobium alkaliphilum]